MPRCHPVITLFPAIASLLRASFSVATPTMPRPQHSVAELVKFPRLPSVAQIPGIPKDVGVVIEKVAPASDGHMELW